MTVTRHALRLRLFAEHFSVVRMPPDLPIPEWAGAGVFVSVTRTPDELSLMLESARIPTLLPKEALVQHDWRLLTVQGPLAFSAVGIARDLVTPLADAGISILPLSTYDTDHLLVPGAQLDESIAALRAAGHTVDLREP